MATTTYMESLILNHALLQQPFSISDWYVGLWTADPTIAGLLAGEVTAGDYARKPVTWDASFTNVSPIVWAPAVTDWGIVTYLCLLNSQVKSSGNMLLYQLRPLLDINPGVSVTISANGLTASMV